LQMRQIMQNLLGNALKFHRPGGCTAHPGAGRTCRWREKLPYHRRRQRHRL
jgi:hypothetical protein